MSHITRVGTKKYRIFIEAGVDPSTGKRQRFSKTVIGSKKDAQKIMVELVDKKSSISFDHIKLKGYLLYWYDDYKDNISEVTARDYHGIIKNHLIPTLGELKLRDIKSIHILNYQKEKLKNGRIRGSGGLSKRTVQSHHRLLSLALKHAISPYGLISNNPCKHVKAPSPSHKARPFTHEETDKILDAIDGILLHTLVHLALYTGMRRSELTGLKWKDIKFQHKLIDVKRSGRVINGRFKYSDLKNESSSRQIIISEKTLNFLKNFKKERAALVNENQPVFLTPRGTPLRPDYITRKFKKICLSLEIQDHSFHDLRHTHATWLLEAGVNPKIVQERLGHSRIETTLNVYSHVSINEQRKAVEILEKSINQH